MKQSIKLTLIFIVMLVAHAATFCHPTCEKATPVFRHVTEVKEIKAPVTTDADNWVLLTRFKY